jgi:ubiquinone/menaquinone biosynthesis C-methylase UbiE
MTERGNFTQSRKGRQVFLFAFLATLRESLFSWGYMTMPKNEISPREEILDHYAVQDEAGRLLRGGGQLEFARTQEILARYLPPPPAVILDVGGGAGIYALPLAKMGYTVHLIDPTPKHVAQAREASRKQPAHPLASADIGDARALQWPDASVNAVLMLGPLYHLTERADRILALQEARRVVHGGGVVVAAAISRFASALDGLITGALDDPEFVDIVQQDLRDGQHRNPNNNPQYFTTAYLHRPDELATEIEDAGLHHVATMPVEGVGWLLQNFDDHWQDAGRRERLLNVIRWLESESSLLGASAHFLTIARKQ